MRADKIVIGEHYRHKDHPKYCYAKALKVLKPMRGVNTNRYIVVECAYSVDKNDSFALIKYFKPSDLIKE